MMTKLYRAWHDQKYSGHPIFGGFEKVTSSLVLGMALAWSSAGVIIQSQFAPATASPERIAQEPIADEALSSLRTAMMQQFNRRFPAEVVIPTYTLLTEKTALLVEASQQFEEAPTQETLEGVRAAWIDATSVWAQGQPFAFGPIHSLGYSTALEFPVDGASLEALLANPTIVETGNLDNLSLFPSVNGFEAIAYLLYGTEGEKPLEAFSSIEQMYLTHISKIADQNARELLQVWQAGQNGYAPYKTVLATAGQAGNRAYLSVEAGTEEIIRGLYNHLDVLVAEELPEMLEAWELESAQFDTIALKHMYSSVTTIQLIYTGSSSEETSSDSALGLSQLVSTENRLTDRDIQQSLETALVNLEAAIADPANHGALTQAHDSLTTVFEYLETDVLALVQSPQF